MNCQAFNKRRNSSLFLVLDMRPIKVSAASTDFREAIARLKK